MPFLNGYPVRCLCWCGLQHGDGRCWGPSIHHQSHHQKLMLSEVGHIPRCAHTSSREGKSGLSDYAEGGS